MRIDIGPEGRVIGTKRVTSDGHVGGLATLAGEDVLIVVPHGQPQFQFSARDYLHAWEKVAKKTADRASKELLGLRGRVPAARDVLDLARREFTPKKLSKLVPSRQEILDLVPTRRDAERMIRKQIKVLRRDARVRAAERRFREAEKQLLVVRKWVEARLPAKAAAKPKARAPKGARSARRGPSTAIAA